MRVLEFQFLRDVDSQLALLEQTDVFYFCGFGGTMPDRLRHMWYHPSPGQLSLIDKIREVVQYDQTLYMGVCGGACMFGDAYWGNTVFKCFDLLEGVDLQYNANVAAGQVQCITGGSTIQITTGCGVAMWLRNGEFECSSMTTVKNAGQWRSFAAENAMRLSEVIRERMTVFKGYSHTSVPNGRWWFSLDGRCWIQHEDGSMLPLLEVMCRCDWV